MILQDFYTILQSAIGKTVQLSHTLSEKEWNEIFGLAKKQALVGIMFEGVERLPQEQWPPRNVVLQWAMMVESIKRRNRQTTDVCLRLIEVLGKDGFETCILKGQANHVYYDGLNSAHSLGHLLPVLGAKRPSHATGERASPILNLPQASYMKSTTPAPKRPDPSP